jgi:hypothetical protein
MDPTPIALPGIDESDPFQELADATVSTDDAVRAERQRCSDVVQAALEQAAMRGLPEGSPVVRILTALKHSIEVG